MQMDSIYDFDIAELLTFDLSLSTRSQWSVTLYHHTEGQLVLLILQKTGFDRVTWPMLDYFISWCVQFALDARNSLVDARNHRLPSIISNNGKFQGRPFFFWLPSSNSAFIHTPHMFSRHRNKLNTFRHTCWWESMSVQRFRKKKRISIPTNSQIIGKAFAHTAAPIGVFCVWHWPERSDWM